MQASQVDRPWLEFREKRTPELRDELILRYAPLVKYSIGRMVVSLPPLLSHEDVLSYGTIGLIQAVDRFDPTLGVKFETYAIRRIQGAILDAVRSLHPRSRDAVRRAREVEQAYDALVQKLGRLPEDQEVIEHLGVTPDEFRSRLAEASTQIVSLDTPLSEDGEQGALIDQIADETTSDVPGQVERQELHRKLVAAIEELSERERLVISLYYYEELTLREISEVLENSTSRVSQLHAAAVFKLRAALRTARVAAAHA